MFRQRRAHGCAVALGPPASWGLRFRGMPPLVFLPGAGGSASFWRPVADRLADLGPVHLFGYPGFGGLPVSRLVLVATSGGVDVARRGGYDWRPVYRADVPAWFLEDRTDLTDRLGEVRARTLLLWSDADPVSPLSVAQFLAERIPDARLVTVSGGAHAFAHERPEEVVAIIRSDLA